jgi:hypothetical protein
LTAEGRRLFTELSREFDLLISLVKGNWADQEESDEAMTKKLFVKKR